MTQQLLGTIVDGVIALAIIAAVAVLLALHDISEPTAIALFGVAVTLIGGSAKALLALHVPTTSRPVAPTPQAPPPLPVATAP